MKWGRATIDFVQRPSLSSIPSKTGSTAHFFETIFDMETSLRSVCEQILTRSSPTGGESEHSRFRVTSHTYELRPRTLLQLIAALLEALKTELYIAIQRIITP